MTPQQSDATEPPWADALLRSIGLERGSSADDIYKRANALANRHAPNTRRLWRWILFFEGLAVLLPMCWLQVAQDGWPAGTVAVSVALCTLLLLGACWWVRWRQQQHLWTRSRVLAEIARSVIATKGWPGNPTHEALRTAPFLQPLAKIFAESTADASNPDWTEMKQQYLVERVDDQAGFYAKRANEAAKNRKKLSVYVTRSLDASLALAVLGLWLGFFTQKTEFFSVSDADVVLALMGAGLPLLAILMQSLSAYLELNRCTGRYAQQWEYLTQARAQFAATADEAEATEMVQEIEQALLAEVAEWFYEMDHAEVYYRSAAPRDLTPRLQLTSLEDSAWSRGMTKVLNGAGLVLGITGRVLFGRVLIIALTSIITALLIISRAPQDAIQSTLLRTADGQLLSYSDSLLKPWEPDKDKADKGFILIAHGLRDTPNELRKDAEGKSTKGDAKDQKAESLHWMTAMQQAIEGELKAQGTPEICLVDWGQAARPSGTVMLINSVKLLLESDDKTAAKTRETPEPEHSATQPLTTAQKVEFATDLVAIRSQGQAVGDVVGMRIVQAIRSKNPLLVEGKPMHFIGHSAGGFLIVRAALVLKRMKLLPNNTRITMLDTPLPDWKDLEELLDGKDGITCHVDYYETSPYALDVPADNQWAGFKRYAPNAAREKKVTGNEAHSFAHTWYIQSVKGTQFEKDMPGFSASPFLKR